VMPAYNAVFDKLFGLGVKNILCPIMTANNMKRPPSYIESVLKGSYGAKLTEDA